MAKNTTLFIFLFTLLFFSCKKEENTNPTTCQPMEEVILEDYSIQTVQYKNMDGIPNNLLSLDIHYPDSFTTLRPVIIYVHGGGWTVGDKSQQLENKIKFCKEEKYVLVSINYRLSPYPYETENADRIKFPIHNIDVADAIKLIHDNIAIYGGNPEKMALLGHSAGAHLVSLTGTNASFLENVGLDFIAIKGVACIDTRGYDIPARIADENVDIQEMYINAFGSDEAENITASPIYNIFENIAYPKFFVATRGSTARIENAAVFVQTLENHGISTTFINGNPYDHEGINNAIGDEGETLVSDPLRAFFASCFE